MSKPITMKQLKQLQFRAMQAKRKESLAKARKEKYVALRREYAPARADKVRAVGKYTADVGRTAARGYVKGVSSLQSAGSEAVKQTATVGKNLVKGVKVNNQLALFRRMPQQRLSDGILQEGYNLNVDLK